MRTILVAQRSDSSYKKLLHWAKLISVTGSTQVLIQAVGFVGGIMVIRLLPTQEYALYTLANTMLGTMVVLADGGIRTGVLSQGGRVWDSFSKLGQVMATGLELRRKFTLISLLVSVPILLYILMYHGANWLTACLIVLALIPAFSATITGTLYEIAPELHQDVLKLQKIQAGVSVARFTLLFTLFASPLSLIALLSAGLPQIIANKRLKLIAAGYADLDSKPDPVVKERILSTVKRLLPASIYYCLSGQLTIWLISIYGSTAGIAQAGALGRLPIALTALTVLFNTLVLPRFSRIASSKKLLLNRFIYVHIGLTLIGIAVIAFVTLFSNQILFILGTKYSPFRAELIVLMVGSIISFIANCTFHLSNSRGWIINPTISIVANILTLAIGISLLNMSTLIDVFKLNLLVSVTQLLINLTYGIYSIVRLPAEAEA